jgi:hypothetical protein
MGARASGNGVPITYLVLAIAFYGAAIAARRWQMRQ